MFNLFKKKPKGLDARQRALEVIRVAKQTISDWQQDTNKFLIEYPEYEAQRNKIIDEIQWIPYVSALIGIHASSNFKIANDTINSLVDILGTATLDEKPLSEEQLKLIKYRLNAYLVRFNRSVTLRDQANASGKKIMEILSEAIFDCANEGVYYFTDKKNYVLASIDNSFKLEKRVPYGMLEMHVRETLMKYFMAFAKHFQHLGYA